MTKRPPEVRIPKSVPLITNTHKSTCKFCKTDEHIMNISGTLICEDCFDDYCEICNDKKPFITVRRKISEQNGADKQICSDCYMKLSCDIVELDKNYGIETIDAKKSDKYYR